MGLLPVVFFGALGLLCLLFIALVSDWREVGYWLPALGMAFITLGLSLVLGLDYFKVPVPVWFLR